MRRKISQSIQIKTFLSMLALLAVCCIIIYGMVMIFLPRNYRTELEGQITSDFYDLVEVLERNGWEASSDSLLEFSMTNNASVEVNNAYGNNLFSVNFANMENLDTSAPSISCSATFQQGGQTYHLFANAALVAVAQSYDILLKLIPFIAVVILLISVIGAVVCSRYYSKPLVSISNVAKRMTTLDMTWKCEVNRKDEIGVLAASLNEMSQRLNDAMDSLKAANWKLQKDIERQREQEKQRVEFFTAVSHELKTPIAIIKGQLEGMIYQVGEYKDRDTYLRRCMKTTNEMEALVKEILSAARMGGGDFHLERTDLDISQMLRKGLPAVPWPDGGQADRASHGNPAGIPLPGRPAAHGEGVYQCNWKCRGLFAGGRGDYCHPKGRGVFRGEYRRPHCRGRFGAYLHAILPGGQIPEPEQRRQRPRAVYHRDHSGPPRNHPQHGQHGKWREIYGVSVVNGMKRGKAGFW